MVSNLTGGIIMACVAVFLSIVLVCIHCSFLIGSEDPKPEESVPKLNDGVDDHGLPKAEEAL